MQFNNIVDHLNYLQSRYLEIIDGKNLKHVVEGFYHKKKFDTLLDCISTFEGQYENIYMYSNDGALLEFPDYNFIRIAEHSNSKVWMNVTGTVDWIKKIRKFKEKTEDKVFIDWSYTSGGGMKTVEIELADVNKICQEYYPFINEDPHAYFKRYLDSTAPVLVLIGDPGTGKTSFIRAMIDKYKMRTSVTFDENVMGQDSYYIDYLTSDEQELMVIEDADLLLTSRDSDQNKTMAKLLNISDGIVKLVRKKIIFSTNLSNLNRIDHALTRPGRCFDVINFRALNRIEAEAAASKAGKTLPSEGSEFHLSEIFNGKLDKPVSKKIGFA